MSKKNKIKPLSFQEVYEQSKIEIPDEVIEAINELILEKYDCEDKSATIDVPEIIERTNTKFSLPYSIKREHFEENGWFCFAYLYEENGWDVEFIQPDENEYFEPYFYFTKG
jgi:hypothetical protein